METTKRQDCEYKHNMSAKEFFRQTLYRAADFLISGSKYKIPVTIDTVKNLQNCAKEGLGIVLTDDEWATLCECIKKLNNPFTEYTWRDLRKELSTK